MKPVCTLLVCVALFALPALSVAAPACPDGKCTYQSPELTVQVTAEVAAHAVVGVAKLPGKVVAKIRNREHKPIVKVAVAVKNRVGRHRCE